MFDVGGREERLGRPAAAVAGNRSAVESPATSPDEVSAKDHRFGRSQSLEAAIEKASLHLQSLQKEDGHWCGELEGDSILESEYVMLLWFLGLEEDPRIEQACRTVRSLQLDNGGWAIYPGGPPDPSASVKAYFVLKLAGDSADAPHMVRAAKTIRELGGVAKTNSFTKIYLAVFQQMAWKDVPAVPPELILTPRSFLLNIAEMSAWSRAIVVPLAMIWALKPKCEVSVTIDELVTGERAERRGTSTRERFWFAFFRGVDRTIKLAEAARLFSPIRERALRECEEWTLKRLPKSAGLAAIVPAIANAAVALRERGYGLEEGPLADQLAELKKLELTALSEEGVCLRLQPCCSPVWDTALSLAANFDADIDPWNPKMLEACRWLLDHEVANKGDWQAKCPETEAGGWYFEYANEFYPDCDDTAEVLAVLHRYLSPEGSTVEGTAALRSALRSEDELEGPATDRQRIQRAVDRGSRWLLAMQNEDGGWGAFDRGCDRELLTFVPFADHNAMIDPSTTDVTARAVEALALSYSREHDAVLRGADFIEGMQEQDGSWYGRWGCNYLYGTWLALGALCTAGRGNSASVRRGLEWLLSVQLENGGWGETLETYADPSQKGLGPATAAQTSWALLGLMAVLRAGQGTLESGTQLSGTEHRLTTAVDRGVQFLLAEQHQDGSWRDELWTGTGFPQVFYLRYHYYDRYFPLQALAQYRRLQTDS